MSQISIKFQNKFLEKKKKKLAKRAKMKNNI